MAYFKDKAAAIICASLCLLLDILRSFSFNLLFRSQKCAGFREQVNGAREHINIKVCGADKALNRNARKKCSSNGAGALFLTCYYILIQIQGLLYGFFHGKSVVNLYACFSSELLPQFRIIEQKIDCLRQCLWVFWWNSKPCLSMHGNFRNTRWDIGVDNRNACCHGLYLYDSE